MAKCRTWMMMCITATLLVAVRTWAQPEVAQPEVAQPEVAQETSVSTEPPSEQAATSPVVVGGAPTEEARFDAVEPPVNVRFDDGFSVRSADGDYALVVGGRVQTRFIVGVPSDGDGSAWFEMTRARFGLGGHAYSEALAYKFEADFGKGSVALKDYFVDYRFIPSVLHVRAGQYKKPFSRQHINSSGRLELVDRAITDRAFGTGRDIGVMLHNNYEKSPTFEWALGLFNGTSDAPRFTGEGEVLVDAEGEPTTDVSITSGKFSNVPGDWRPSIVARAGYNHGAMKGYSEADFEGGPLRLAVAASVEARGAEDSSQWSWTPQGDVLLKAHGLSVSGAVYHHVPAGDEAGKATGFHAQLGYVLGKVIQPALRFALVDPEGPTQQQEITAGFGYYPWQHRFKVQADAGMLTSREGDDEASDWLLRTQLQLTF